MKKYKAMYLMYLFESWVDGKAIAVYSTKKNKIKLVLEDEYLNEVGCIKMTKEEYNSFFSKHKGMGNEEIMRKVAKMIYKHKKGN